MFARWSLRTRLTVVMTLLVMLTLGAVTVLTLRVSRRTLERQMGENFGAQAQALNDLLVGFFEEKAGHLSTLALSDAIEDGVRRRNAEYTGGDEESLAQVRRLDAAWATAGPEDPGVAGVIDPQRNPAAAQLAAFLQRFGEHAEVFVTDRHGATVAATGRLSDYYQADEEWWQGGWAGGQGAVFISDPAPDASAGVTALQIAVPVRDRTTGEAIGVLRSTLNVNKLFQLIAKWNFGQTGHATLLNGAGVVVADSVPTIGHGAAAQLPERLRQSFVSARSGFMTALDEEDVSSLFGHAAIEPGTPGSIAARLAAMGWTSVIRQKRAEACASADAITEASLWAGVAALLLAIVAGVVIASATARRLDEMGAVAEQIGAGDFGVTLPVGGSPELRRLAESFAAMATRLQRQRSDILRGVTQLREHGAQVAAEVAVLGPSARAILSATGQVAENAAETSTAIEQTTRTVETLRRTARDSSDKAREVADEAHRAAEISHSGKAATEATIDGMHRIREQMGAITRSMAGLREQAQAIGEIISAVDQLAQQSNLLAVNAAIEAARAGDRGKGFAVVAHEMKSLANQSQQATTQVRTLLEQITQAGEAADRATIRGTEAAAAGLALASEAGEAIVTLAGRVAQNAQAAAEIVASSREQFLGMDQVATAMQQVKAATVETAGSVQALDLAAQRLSAVGENLQRLVVEPVSGTDAVV